MTPAGRARGGSRRGWIERRWHRRRHWQPNRRHRYPSRADPATYLPQSPKRPLTENDILYRPGLPGFAEGGSLEAGTTTTTTAPPALSQRDSELLLSYLTVPYIRLTLVLTFFASEDRVHKLASKSLRGLLDAVLFEPGRHLALKDCGVAPETYGREYDPSDLFDAEHWIPKVFEPVRRAFFDGPSPPPLQFLLPDAALPGDAEVCELLGLHQKLGGPSKRVVLFRRRRCAHVYELASTGAAKG